MSANPFPANEPVLLAAPEDVVGLKVRSAVVAESMGRPFRIDLELIGPPAFVSASKVMGKPMTVLVNIGEAARHFNGLVGEFQFIGTQLRANLYRAVLRPWVWFLSRSINCRIFQNQSALDIIKEVLRPHASTELEIAVKPREPREFVVQYRESDLSFATRLMEEEGLYYYFKHLESRHVLVLCELEQPHEPADGFAALPFFPVTRQRATFIPHIDAWEVTNRVEANAYASNDFDFTKPDTDLLVRSALPANAALGDLELFDYPGEYLAFGEGEKLARVRPPASPARARDDGANRRHARGDAQRRPAARLQPGGSEGLGLLEEVWSRPDGLVSNERARFFAGSAEADAPVIAVTVTPVAFEVPVDVWLRMSLAAEGWQIVSARWFPGPNGLFFEATGLRGEGERQQVRRSSVRADGNLVFSVTCLCGRRHWDTAKEIFWTAHVTFKLLGATGTTRMELWAKAAATTPDFSLAHPMSWSAEAAPTEPSPDRVSALHVRLSDAKGQILLAYLQVKALEGSVKASADLAALGAASATQLRRAGVTPLPGERPLTDDDDPRALGVEGWLGGLAGQARMGGAVVSSRFGYVQRDSVTFSLTLLSPTPGDDALTSLRALRVFEIARATLRLDARAETPTTERR